MARYANRHAKRRQRVERQRAGEARALMFGRLGLLNQLLRRIGIEPPIGWLLSG